MICYIESLTAVPCVMLVHSLSALVVVVRSVRVLEGYPLATDYPELFVTHPPTCPICGHQHHDTVFLFHSEDMKRPIAKLTAKYIHGLNILVSEVSLDLLTIDIARLVPPLLGENGSIYPPLLCIHQCL